MLVDSANVGHDRLRRLSAIGSSYEAVSGGHGVDEAPASSTCGRGQHRFIRPDEARMGRSAPHLPAPAKKPLMHLREHFVVREQRLVRPPQTPGVCRKIETLFGDERAHLRQQTKDERRRTNTLSGQVRDPPLRRLAKINCLVWDVISAQDCNSSRRGTCPA